MSLTLLHEKCFLEISAILAGRSTVSPEPTLLMLFDKIRTRNRTDDLGYTDDQLDDAEFAVSALADQMAINNRISGCNLVSRKFGHAIAGIVIPEFRRRLAKISSPGKEDIEVLEIFALCLLFGYSAGAGSPTAEEVADHVERLLGRKPSLNVGSTFMNEPGSRPYDLFTRAAATAIPAAVLISILYLLLWR